MTDNVELVFDAKCRTTESPTFDAVTNSVVFADTHGGRIFSYAIADGRVQEWKLPERVGSLGLCTSGRLVVAIGRRIVLFDRATEAIEVLSDEVPEPADHSFHDGKVGPDGCYWVGTAGGAGGAARSSDCGFYRVTPSGELQEKATGFRTTNGTAFSPDGRTIYHADSPIQVIDSWDFDAASGALSNRRTLARFGPDECRPDGANCDVDGNYWTGGVRNGMVFQFSPQGMLLSTIEMPTYSPTMPCFADGALFVTSLARRQGEEGFDRPHNVAGLFRVPAPIAGAPVALFADE